MVDLIDGARHLKRGKQNRQGRHVKVRLHSPGSAKKPKEPERIRRQHIIAKQMDRRFDVKNTVFPLRKHLHKALFAGPKSIPVLGGETNDVLAGQHANSIQERGIRGTGAGFDEFGGQRGYPLLEKEGWLRRQEKMRSNQNQAQTGWSVRGPFHYRLTDHPASGALLAFGRYL